MKPITAESFEGRALLALRAGAMSAEEASERWPTCGTRPFQALLKIGFVDFDGDRYALTPAGRAACPCRNPLAANAAVSPEVFEMPKGEIRITRAHVLAVIKDAGAAGIHRKDLIERFGCPESTLDNHIMHLAKGDKPAIFRPRPGLCVASFIPVMESTDCREKTAESLPQPALSSANCAQAQTVCMPDEDELLPASGLGISTEAPVEEIEIKPVPDRRAPILVEHDEDFEVGIFSSGEMSIQIEDGLNETEIRLCVGAVIKLRRFLGLFQEAG